MVGYYTPLSLCKIFSWCLNIIYNISSSIIIIYISFSHNNMEKEKPEKVSENINTSSRMELTRIHLLFFFTSFLLNFLFKEEKTFYFYINLNHDFYFWL